MKLLSFAGALVLLSGSANAASVSTLIGTGIAGNTAPDVNQPFGMVIGPDGALYFCDYSNNHVRRVDLKTLRTTIVAGNGFAAYVGDGGPAVDAALKAPHELAFDKKGDLYIAERDNHVIRKVNMKTGIISTAVGTGVAGFGGDGGPGAKAQLRQPHCILRDRDGSMLICDIGNHRIRRFHPETGVVETYIGTGAAASPADGTPTAKATLNGPRALAMAANGDLYVALREGNSIYVIDRKTQTLRRIAGTGENGYAGDGGPALSAKFGGTTARLAGPKGLAVGPDGNLYIADTESHAIRRIDLKTGVITTVLGTGQMGDGPETTPLGCKLSRPHALLFVGKELFVADSESHRIRVLKME